MRTLQVVAGVISRGGKILIAQRKDSCPREPGKWEFPGGRIEEGETPQEALVREIREELGADIEVGGELCETFAESGGVRIAMRTFRATWVKGEPRAIDCKDFRWVRPDELRSFDWAQADIPIARKLSGANPDTEVDER